MRRGSAPFYCRGLTLLALLAPIPASAFTCQTTQVVKQAGGGDCTSIQQCVNNIPSSLTGDWCIDIQDSATYPEQVTVQGVNSNGFRIVIGTSTAAQTPIVSPPAASTGAFIILNSSVSLLNLNIRPAASIPYGVFTSSTYVRISSVNVQDAGANIYRAGIAASSWTTVSYTSVTVGNAGASGFWLPGSVMTSVSYSSAQANGSSGAAALWINGASSNTFTMFLASSTAGYGMELDNGSNDNSVNGSTIASFGGVYPGLYLIGASSNTITSSNMTAPANAGTSADLETGSAYNTISQSAMTASGGAASLGLLLTHASFNTITGSFITNSGGIGAFLTTGANSNTIISSTMTISAAGVAALKIFTASSSNTITNCSIGNQPGTAVLVASNAKYNTISLSTMTSSAANKYALVLNLAQYNTFAGDSIQGSTAAWLTNNSIGNAISGSVLTATNTFGAALQMDGGSAGLTVSGSVLTTPASGAAVYLDVGDGGPIVLSTNTLSGGAYGIFVATPMPNTQIWITSNTIVPSLSATQNTYGLYLDGLVAGATIQNNGVYYRAAGAGPTAGKYAYSLYAQSSNGLVIANNRFNEPGMITSGDYGGIALAGATGTMFKFNDVNATGGGFASAYLLQLAASPGTVVKDNVFFSSFAFATTGSSASITVDAASQAGFSSNYNDWFSSNSFNTGLCGGVSAPLNAAWTCNGSQDANSISSNPLWSNPAAGVEDFHPLSQTGRYRPGLPGYLADCSSSLSIDAADPAEAFALEPSPNGSRANQGSYGGSAQASETFLPSPPSSIGASALIGEVVLSWTPPSPLPGCGSYVDHYEISYTSVTQTGPFVFLSAVSSTAFIYVHAGLSSGTTYFYQTLTVDAQGIKSVPVSAYAVTPDTIAPAAVANLSGAPGGTSGQISLSWIFPGDDNGTTTLPYGSQYAVQYTTDNLSVVWSTSNAQVNISTGNVAVGAAQAAAVSGLTQPTTYYFRLWTAHPGPFWSMPSNIAVAFSRQPSPSILSLSPANGATGVTLGSSLGVSFSGTMQYGSVLAGVSLTLIQDSLGNSTNTAVAAVFSPAVSSNAYTIAPSSPLVSNGTYRLAVAASVVDFQGNPLASAATAQFVTLLDHTVANVFAPPGSSLNVRFPAGALASDGFIGFSTTVVSANIATANGKLVSNTGDGARVPIPGSIVDLKAYDTLGNVQSASFAVPVSVSLPYPNVKGDGIVDGTIPPVRADTLGVWWLDEANALWVKLPNSSVDLAGKRVTASTAHFTTFALIGQSASDLSNAYAFPVPFRPKLGHATITFTGLGQNSRIRVFTIGGALVADMTSTSVNGQLIWLPRTSDGKSLASGVYLYVIQDGSNTAKGKLMVIQ